MTATRLLERGFALAAAAVFVVAVATVGVGAGQTTEKGRDSRLAFDTGVPQEYQFDVPATDGVARVDGRRYEAVDGALAAAEPGDTVRLRGRFDERVVIRTDGVTLRPAGTSRPVIDGGGNGTVVNVQADDVTLRGLWIRNGGYDTSDNDAALWVNGSGVSVVDNRITEMTFGIWLNGVTGARVVGNTIVGRECITPLTRRGNGIQIWKVRDSVIANNRITDVRDGMYFSWSSHVVARNNTMWDLRYGVHYMYSDHCQLRNNTAFDNDVGYALMVSEQLRIVGNVAVKNTGRSGHGILVKSVDDTVIRGNDLVANHKGLFIYNSLNNTVAGNLLLGNDVGVHVTAGSTRERVFNNSFIRNDRQVLAVIERQVYWNETRGNFWSGATTVDIDDDGIGDTRYQPAGAIQRLTAEKPAMRVFTTSPAFDAVRLAQSTVPVVESPGIVDARPLVTSPHDDWRRYYERD
ncbi:right-handed parallel beta-helix repeat-containing protein [Halobellus sp. EA9]|uniref:right-handed parallel beta-helix repeat-containing protein n=1 Tax=Halobellus sp. EA9 TaxID=3421647 RepID=UPI003EBC3E72